MLQQCGTHLKRITTCQLDRVPERLLVDEEVFVALAKILEQAFFNVAFLLDLANAPFDLAVCERHHALVLLGEMLVKICDPLPKNDQAALSWLPRLEQLQFLGFGLFKFDELLFVFFTDDFVQGFANGEVDQEGQVLRQKRGMLLQHRLLQFQIVNCCLERCQRLDGFVELLQPRIKLFKLFLVIVIA